ncbi:hypothetical protein MJI20_31420, partial [Salmonella enterica subsp. enterica serovar Anatum]|nr:hypothetical protein [Salmonella enterica subsp. enterica serovar Anatum]
DALMVRSVTKVNESLLSGTPINFVGTATAGTDHVDEAWLKQAVEERRIAAAGSTMQCRITQTIVRPHIIRRVRQPKIATTSAFA